MATLIMVLSVPETKRWTTQSDINMAKFRHQQREQGLFRHLKT